LKKTINLKESLSSFTRFKKRKLSAILLHDLFNFKVYLIKGFAKYRTKIAKYTTKIAKRLKTGFAKYTTNLEGSLRVELLDVPWIFLFLAIRLDF